MHHTFSSKVLIEQVTLFAKVLISDTEVTRGLVKALFDCSLLPGTVTRNCETKSVIINNVNAAHAAPLSFVSAHKKILG
jgi:hypothetical protein